MSIIRVAKKTNPFVMIDKTCLEDSRLSWKAKGLLAYLLSRPDRWNVKVSHLIKQSTDGRDAVYSAINELREYGYCYRSPRQKQDITGKLIGYEYTIYELPEAPPCTDYPDKEKPYKEKPTHNNIDSNNINEEEESLAKLSKLYENNLGMITPVSAEWLKDAVDEYPADWFEPALKEMLKNNVRTWNYWEAILKRWKRDGFQVDSRPKRKSNTRKDNKHGFIKPNRTLTEDEIRELAIAEVERRKAARAG